MSKKNQYSLNKKFTHLGHFLDILPCQRESKCLTPIVKKELSRILWDKIIRFLLKVKKAKRES